MAVLSAKSALDVTSGVMPRLTGWFDLELGRQSAADRKTRRKVKRAGGTPAVRKGSFAVNPSHALSALFGPGVAQG